MEEKKKELTKNEYEIGENQKEISQNLSELEELRTLKNKFGKENKKLKDAQMNSENNVGEIRGLPENINNGGEKIIPEGKKEIPEDLTKKKKKKRLR